MIYYFAKGDNMLLKTKDICDILGIDRNTLYRWMRNDDFPKIRVGGTWRFELDKVKEWAENGMRNAECGMRN